MSAQPVTLRPRARLGRVQQQIWTAQRLAPASPLANMGTRSTIRGPLEPARFQAAFERVVRDSDALRTVITDVAGVPVPRVLSDPPRSLQILDLPADEMDAWITARVGVPIDPSVASYDAVLVRHGAEHWTWWLDLHHVITDAWSSALVFKATAAAYAGEPVEIGAWVTYLDGLPAPDRMPPGSDVWGTNGVVPPIAPYGPTSASTTAVQTVDLELDEDDRRRLAEALAGPFRSLSDELSLLALLVATVAAWEHRLDGRELVRVGVPIHHRSGRFAPTVVGPLMELFPLDVAVEPADTFRALHRRAGRALLELLRRAKPGTSPDQSFDVVVNVLTARFGSFAGLDTVNRWVRAGHADPAHLVRVHALAFDLAEGEPITDGLHVELDVNHALGPADVRAHVPDHLGALLRAGVTDPDAPIGAVDLRTPDEVDLDRLVTRATERPQPSPPVVAALREGLRAAGDRTVVRQGAREVSGLELDRLIGATAAWLRHKGIGRGERVALEVTRSVDAVVLVHAVLRAGAAFVLLDPEHPPARRADLVAEAGAALVLDGLPHDLPGDLLDEPSEVEADDLAYILFTSGSTGTPKGVPITHRGLSHYLRFAVEAYTDPARPPTVALHSPLTFDLTVTSLFLPFLSGGRLVVIPDDGVAGLQAIAADRTIDFLKATPSHLEMLARLIEGRHPIRTLVVGGEAFRRPLALRLHEVCDPELRIYNEYGPTEAVVGCMIHRFDPEVDTGPDVPIGHAAPEVELHVVDRHDRPVPQGAWGELLIGRPGMAAGYLDRPELTAERFVRLDHLGGRTLYRSGDRVRVERPGVLVYGGRTDDQLKVGGVRLEPGEVEAALTEHPDVGGAVVRIWSPGPGDRPVHRCPRCGLGDDVPDISFDDEGVCSTCRAYDDVRDTAAHWFLTPADLDDELAGARRRTRGEFDALFLLSGGKDSTYALYRLVELGWRVHAFTLDNGFISEQAKDNIRRTVAHLGVSHEFATTDAMAAIFRDSLERFSNVCNGCYKTIYTLAVNRAHELGIPAVVTGLSRGQFFETRLTPGQFALHRFATPTDPGANGHAELDPTAIDAAVLEARKVYHRTADAVSEHLDVSLFDGDAVFDEIRFVDFYRYVDVSLTELYAYLDANAPWVRPTDTGRSTNCLINAAGIYVHKLERGFHNYALPYSWDVKLGHKTRDEALDELDDDLDESEVLQLLAEVGYQPRPPRLLTAWYLADREVDPEELRAHLRRRLPEHAIPAAFVRIHDLPLSAHGKVDAARLPAPSRFHRASASYAPPTTEVERSLCEIWAGVLGLERVGLDDDFFDLGGASLDALEMIVWAEERLGVDVPEVEAFRQRTVRALATVVEQARAAVKGAGSASPSVREAIATLPAGDRPLSAGQEALLYEVRSHPGSSRYGVTRRYRIEGALDLAALRDALLAVVARHDTLRTTFGRDRAVLAPEVALRWDETLPAWPDEADEIAARQARTPFDLDHGPLVRAVVVPVRLPADGGPGGHDRVVHDLMLSLHHLWCDAGSFAPLWADLGRAYRREDLEPLGVTYAEHAAWQRSRVSDADRRYWVDALAGVHETPLLATARPAEPEADGYATIDLPVSAAEQTRLFPAFVSAIGVVLDRIGSGPLVVGVPASTRDHAAAAPLIGYFLNTLPIALPPIEADTTFASLVAATEERLASGLRHRTVPFSTIVADRRRVGEVTDLVRVMAVLDEPSGEILPGLRVRGETIFNGCAVADLSFFVRRGADRVELSVEWSGAHISETAARAALTHLHAVLIEGLRAPGRPVVELAPAYLPDDLVGPPLAPASEPVTRAVWRRMSGALPAVVGADGTLTYAELVARAERVAAHLARAGVVAGERVALVIPRRVDQIAAILGVLRLGAAYVPIDPAYPASRIERIVTGARPAALLAAVDVAAFPAADVPVLDLDRCLAADAGREPPPARPDLDDPAYVIFTSGSTGVPRGVEVTHRSLAASTAARLAHYGDDPVTFLWTSSYGFDSSVAGLWWALASGGCLVLPDDARSTDVEHLAALIEHHGVTHLLTVPALYGALLDRAGDRLRGLRAAVVAGEASSVELVRRHHDVVPHTDLWNEYGPTEATVWATAHRLDPADDTVPIGRPVPGAVVRVAGEGLRPRPVGVAGELLVGGPGVVAGYTDDVPATAARFVHDDGGARWYRTGDLVVRRTDDVLEFLGRLDDQLSVGGIRVEPDEIEQHLLAVPGVTAAVVRLEPRPVVDLADALAALPAGRAQELLRAAAATDDPAHALVDSVARAAGGPERLVAHVEALRLDTVAVRKRLALELPANLVPVEVVRHDRLPRTPHGKLDRQAVPLAPHRAAARGLTSPGRAIPVDESTRRLLSIWQRVLADPRLGPDDDFFDAGGDSLRAVELALAIGDELGLDVPVTALLDARTAREMAVAIQATEARAAGPDSSDLCIPLRRPTDHAAPGGSPSLFLVANGAGTLFRYHGLVDALGRHDSGAAVPLYGFQYPAADGRGDPVRTIAGLAERFLPDVLAAQPEGPLRLLGWSTGGLVAYDLAHRLLAVGRDVELVVLVDSFYPGEQRAHHEPRRVRYGRRLREHDVRGLVREARTAAGYRLQDARDLAHRARQRRRGGVVDPDVMKRWFFAIAEEAAMSYVPRPLEVPVVLYAASETDPARTEDRWREIVADLTVVRFEGTHGGEDDSILNPDRVAPLAADLAARL